MCPRRPTTGEPVEEGGEPVEMPAEPVDQTQYKYTIDYKLATAGADLMQPEFAASAGGLEAVLEPLELAEDKTAAAGHSSEHSSAATIGLRDAVGGGGLVVTLTETYTPPPPEPVEGEEEPAAEPEPPVPVVVARGKLSLESLVAGLSQGSEVKGRVELLPLVPPPLVSYERHPDRRLRTKPAKPRQVEATAVAIGTVEVTVSFNVEPEFPPEPEPDVLEEPVKGKKKKKKKKKK